MTHAEHEMLLLSFFAVIVSTSSIHNNFNTYAYRYDNFPTAQQSNQIMPFHIRHKRVNIAEGNIRINNMNVRKTKDQSKDNEFSESHVVYLKNGPKNEYELPKNYGHNSDDGGGKQNIHDTKVLGHHIHENVHKPIKKIAMLYSVKKTIPHFMIKNISYPVKVPVPQPNAIEKKIPYAMKVLVKVPVKIPRPVPVIKKVPYPINVPVDRPVPVKVYVPKPYPIEKKIHYEIKIPVPNPFPIERKIPVPMKISQLYPVEKVVHYPVKIAMDKLIPVSVSKPYSIPITMPVSYPIEKSIPIPVKVHVPRKANTNPEQACVGQGKDSRTSIVSDRKKIPCFVEKFVRVPVKIQVQRLIPIDKSKAVEYYIEKSISYPVKIPVAVPIDEQTKNKSARNSFKKYI